MSGICLDKDGPSGLEDARDTYNLRSEPISSRAFLRNSPIT